MAFDKNALMDVICLDFNKASDIVRHEMLLIKFMPYGITGNLLKWLSVFSQAKQSVIVNASYLNLT